MKKYLYVDSWDEKHKVILRYDVRPESTLTNEKLFFDGTREPEKTLGMV